MHTDGYIDVPNLFTNTHENKNISKKISHKMMDDKRKAKFGVCQFCDHQFPYRGGKIKYFDK